MKLPKQSHSVARDMNEQNRQMSAIRSAENNGVYPSYWMEPCEIMGTCPTVPLPFPMIFAGRYRTRAAGAGIG
jgi:hypothetical protein